MLKRLVNEKLNGCTPDIGLETTFQLTQTVKMHVLGTNEWLDGPFIFGGYCDHNAGGAVRSEIMRNVQICVDRKTKQVERYRAQHDTWWLLLIDTIGFGLNERERQLFVESPNVEHNWDKVNLVDPRHHARALEI